jgi:hypothetical protein
MKGASIQLPRFLKKVMYGIFLLCIAGVAAFISPPVQKKIEKEMLRLKDYLIAGLEGQIKRKISYDAISPSIFQAIDISNLKIWNDKMAAPLLDVHRFRIHYNLFDLIFGDIDEAIREIILENASINFDRASDADLIRLFSGDGSVLPAERPDRKAQARITGRNIRIRLRTGEDEFSAEKLFFQILPEGKDYNIRLKTLLSYTNHGKTGIIHSGETLVSMRGALSPSYTSGDLTLGLSLLSTNIFDLKKQVFQIAFSPAGVQVRKIQDRAPLDFTLAYAWDTREIRMDFLSQRFIPASLITMKSDFAFLNDWLGMAVSSQGSLSYALGEGELKYDLRFDGTVKNTVITRETRFSGSAGGTDKAVNFSPLTLSGQYGSLSFTGDLPLDSFYPSGNLSIKNFTLQGPQPLNASLRIKREPAGVSVSGETVSWGESLYKDFFIRLETSARSLLFNGNLTFGSAEESEARLFFLFPLEEEDDYRFYISLRDVPAEDIRTPLKNFFPRNQSLSSLYPLLDDSSLRINGSLFGETGSRRKTNFEIPRLSLFRKDNRDDYIIDVSGNYDTEHWEISEWSFRWGSHYGRGNLLGDILPDGRFSFTTALNILDIPYSFGGTFNPAGSLRIDGSYGLGVDVSWQKWGEYTGVLRLDDFPVPVLYDVMRVTGTADFHYTGVNSWSLKTDAIRILRFSPFSHITANLNLSAELGPEAGTINDFVYADTISTLRGNGNFLYSRDPLSVYAKLNLTNAGAAEDYSFAASYRNGVFAGRVFFQDSPLERFAGENGKGRLSGLVEFDGLPENPRVSVRLDTSDCIIRGEPASLRFEGKIENGQTSVSVLEAEYSGFRISDTSVLYTSEKGNLDIAAALRTGAGEEEVLWNFKSAIVLADTENIRASKNSFLDKLIESSINGRINFSTASARIVPEFQTWNFTVLKTGRNARISGGFNNSLDMIVRESGSFTLNLKDPFPVTFEAEGLFTEDDFEANINKISFRVEDFSWLFDFDILQLTRGQASGNLRLSGPPQDPDIYGTVAVAEGYADLELMPDELGPYRGNLIFREKEFTLQPMLVPAGTGSAVVSGNFRLDHWMPVLFSLVIDTQESSGIRIAYTFNSVAIDGIAQGILHVDGDTREIKVDGDILASNATVTTAEEEDEPANTGPAPEGRFVSLNLRFEAGKALEFYWPTVDFPIIETFASRGEKVTFRYNGETKDYNLVGNVNTRGGEIFWFDRRFFIREGHVRFDENAESFDPIVSVRAEIRESMADGLVRIYLVADNTHISQFSPRFESDRGLTNSEILAVLGTNVFGSSGEDALNIASAVPITGDFLAQIGVVKALEKNVREILNLDLFSVRTHLVQNILQGVITPAQETNVWRETPAFGRYLDKTSVFLGKYIGSDLFLNFMLQFRAQDLLAREEDVYGGMVMDAEIVLEWKTPFFLLDWSFMPKHPDELFIFDNVFTFRWRFAF